MSVFNTVTARLTVRKRAAATIAPCTPPYTYETVFCKDGSVLTGCFDGNPCAEGVEATSNLSVVPTLGAREITLNLIPAAAPSSAAATSTRTTKAASPAQTKTATATSSNDLLSSSVLPTSSSQSTPKTSTTSAQIATSVAAISSAPTETSRPSSHSHSNTAAVAAGTVGAIVGAVVALTMILLVLRWSKRRTKSKVRATQHDNDLPLQKEGANGVVNGIQDLYGRECDPAYRDADHNSLLYPQTKRTGNDGHATNERWDLHSAGSSLSPIPSDPEMPGSTPDPTGHKPELEVPTFHVPAELALNAERSSINTPRKNLSPSRVNSSGQGGLRQTADGSVMHPNLNSAGGEAGSRGAFERGNNHVMSWMSYDGDGSGPVH